MGQSQTLSNPPSHASHATSWEARHCALSSKRRELETLSSVRSSVRGERESKRDPRHAVVSCVRESGNHARSWSRGESACARERGCRECDRVTFRLPFLAQDSGLTESSELVREFACRRAWPRPPASASCGGIMFLSPPCTTLCMDPLKQLGSVKDGELCTPSQVHASGSLGTCRAPSLP